MRLSLSVTGSALALVVALGSFTSLPAQAANLRHHHQQAPQDDSSAPASEQEEAGSTETSEAPRLEPLGGKQDTIIAVINGQPLTQRDVDNRGRLFVLSTGLPLSEDIMQRLRPQIVRQLIDERLRTQEILSRHINVSPEQIADAITNIEKRNGMEPNMLRNHLAKDGVSLTTLIDQIRVQIGWMQVLRQELGSRSRMTSLEIAQRQEALGKQQGRPEYLISEIFVPVADPRHSENELKFTETIIQQLRRGAPFPIVAAQFSQAQSALDGGSMGWVQEDSLDPEVVAMVRQMPEEAISNPIKVAGGYVIATVLGKRIIGQQPGTLLDTRQAFLPFGTPLNPQAPTEQQRQTLEKAVKLSQTAHSCEDLAAANKQFGEVRPSNPGELQLERLNPQMQQILAGLPVGKATRPLVSQEGIDILMVCGKKTKNFADRSPSEIADQLLNERVEQTARQLDRDLHRRAVIDMRTTMAP
ncbi:peptidylprolyl isomerase [Acetobacter sp.]|jgi:peptidyl-prolyl cis-trans isomerase SurA|uniref:peptidylprolyl isomerase n=1 Tax=Acetobacter sp. TaxID=440 RepID=UPI0025BC2F56|nr:peptidylprolyl isomerase [Acetobacter sp.]MCH4090546.1 peptidylprolyl isomerase [Acetobacter sp.]MCI1299240.1 peptidylprolyl isomerase [Acetobacter sp.]MCI1315787.1 peptidylprolyl isomerase [Acetobacter sp.]